MSAADAPCSLAAVGDGLATARAGRSRQLREAIEARLSALAPPRSFTGDGKAFSTAPRPAGGRGEPGDETK